MIAPAATSEQASACGAYYVSRTGPLIRLQLAQAVSDPPGTQSPDLPAREEGSYTSLGVVGISDLETPTPTSNATLITVDDDGGIEILMSPSPAQGDYMILPMNLTEFRGQNGAEFAGAVCQIEDAP